ncbi:family 16 glycosylhydrolase [Saccharicrinis sp. 156]|uniref:family 16 glycosylhydrolase n=1 Tax=Saccharicrinis sp. 156 TaxID=3417574 RepID=UPI003D355A43
MKTLATILLSILFVITAYAQNKQKQSPPDSWLTPLLADSAKYILESKDSIVWGCAPIYDDEGKVHVYYSTWEKEGNWLIHSKIAHAVADHPEGPYKKLGVIMEGRQGMWDAHTIHNPTIYRVDGKYMMLYIGNDTTQQDNWRDRAKSANTQRVGMAIADNPYGPWKRFDKPVIDVSPDTMAWDGYCTVNPGFLKHPNGEYWIYYRSWDRRNDDRRKTGVAMAKSLEGPYVKYKNNPVIDFPERGGQTEDPYFFYYKNKFHCLIRDMGNYDWLSGLYLESEDGLNWGQYYRSHHKGAHYLPLPEKARYERVQVLFRNGEPEYLYNAVLREGRKHSGAVLKINMPEVDNPLPPAPAGYQWIKNEKFSDEFNGSELDTTRWHQRSPFWKHGRPPATFRDYSVSVQDGYMQIKNSVLEGDPKYNIAGGAVASKAMDARFGYYECRMKASSISMSSTFWLKNLPEKDGCTRNRQELDIVEVVGKRKTGHDFTNILHSNTHYQLFDCQGNKNSKSVGGNCPIVPASNEAFHTYGCWWKDANTLLFYLDGEYKFTIKPSTEFNDKPFNRPMYMHLVTETYNWESPPTVEELNNDKINTTYYDWVRSYKLVPIKTKAGEGLTKPKKFYKDTVDFSIAPVRLNNKYPLSDQKNNGKWKLLKDYSDEFSDDTLDIKKWYPNNPGWKGRKPTYFHGSNVSLEGGELIMQINQHGNEKLPDGYTHSAGFIKSKKKILYGYVEARLKPMNAPWVTGFWMTNVSKDWWTEIDICENCPGVEDNRHDLNSNIHVFKAPKDKGDVKKHFSRNEKFHIPFELQKDYHTWGLEWDKDYIRFYLDGVLFREAENTHWHQPLEINLNNESNKWFGALPDDTRLNELYKVDYVRVWTTRR